MSIEPNNRILIVDDNAQIHRDFRDILSARPAPATTSLEKDLFDDAPTTPAARMQSFEIECHSDGQAACAATRARVSVGRPFAVAFVDMHMSGWDGLKTIENLYAIDSEIQVVLCTAYSDHSWDDVRARIGQTDRLLILRKPFDAVEVQQLASSLCSKWHLSQISRQKMVELEQIVADRTQQLQRTNATLLVEIEERKQIESKIRHAATHDPLTGLANRAAFSACVARQLAMAAPVKGATAVMYLDLDGFKEVNDFLGHAAGDALLVEVAKRIESRVTAVEPEAAVARLGGDEFAIMLGRQSDQAKVDTLANAVLAAVGEPIHVMSREVTIGCSVGVTMGNDYQVGDEILRDADLAMYEAKREGKRRVVWYDERLTGASFTKFDIEMEIGRALRKSEFGVVYQPIVSLSEGRIKGLEALVRWRHPQRGEIAPSDFIRVAEHTGQIDQIGEFVLRSACRQLADWSGRYRHLADATMSVNASPRQFFCTNFCEIVGRALDESGLTANRLQIEIVESLLMEELPAIEANLNRLRKMGVNLVLDDFGTGYSSLASLHRLPISGLKLDKSFVARLEPTAKGAATVGAILQIAKTNNLTVIAEGVETVEQLLQLQAVDCDSAQGFLLSRPHPPQQLEQLFDNSHEFLDGLRRRILAAA